MASLHVGLDIGGTLAKVVTIAPKNLLDRICTIFPASVMVHEKLSTEQHDIHPADLGFASGHGPVCQEFAMFSLSSRDIGSLISFLKHLLSIVDGTAMTVPITGGGAVKFRSDLESAFPAVRFQKVDEMEAISVGFSFLVRRPNAAFLFNSVDASNTPVPLSEVEAPFPLLLVNIGSGVSMIKIDGPDEYQRVQVSPIGGGTVLGLGKALFGATSFEEIMELSKRGDSSKVDLSVGELIGASPNDAFWSHNTLASSLTKLSTRSAHQEVSRADLAQSLVRMVSYNIGYVAYLVSCLHGCNRIYFSGKYVNQHIPTMEAISYAVKFYENWKPPPAAEGSTVMEGDESPVHAPRIESRCDVRFLHHEGYVGAIGALISSRRAVSVG